eukprot:CAMPEP_0117884786 /NCGR_PEP_ID=MMETSP0950-20121206/19142_1 /TAXON_ID=44440 /ORGANISM="Chattonella subsalsa, Strain CCMP2191" /LENGTH=33 /DNA_ID= /DNA_START= /DNA_END= /DNA_ORIENTATION=
MEDVEDSKEDATFSVAKGKVGESVGDDCAGFPG